MTPTNCVCAVPNSEVQWRDRRDIGLTDGYWDLTTMKCTKCGSSWLRAFIEYEAFPRSGRYYRIPIPEAFISLTPEAGLSVIEDAPFKIAGGSYFGGHERSINGSGKLMESP